MALVYSCCFWFSLRLSGVLIGIFTMMQAVILMSYCCYWYSNPRQLQSICVFWISNINLIYTKDFVESLQADPKKWLSIIIITTCIYIIICMVFVYGACKCNNVLMTVYVVIELVRLIGLSALVLTLLLMLKQNTMDLGLLIGASVIGGFILLGSFYFWVCAANLPLLINEKDHDEQTNRIEKLQQLLNANKPPDFLGYYGEPWQNYKQDFNREHIFTILRHKTHKSTQRM